MEQTGQDFKVQVTREVQTEKLDELSALEDLASSDAASTDEKTGRQNKSEEGEIGFPLLQQNMKGDTIDNLLKKTSEMLLKQQEIKEEANELEQIAFECQY